MQKSGCSDMLASFVFWPRERVAVGGEQQHLQGKRRSSVAFLTCELPCNNTGTRGFLNHRQPRHT